MTYSALTVQDLSMDMWHGYMIRTMRASTYDVTKGPKPSHQASAKYMKKSKAFVSQSVKRYFNMKKRWWFARSCPPPPSPHKHRQKLRIEWFCRYLEETPSIVACSGQTRLRKKGVITSCNTTKRYLVAHGVKLWRTIGFFLMKLLLGNSLLSDTPGLLTVIDKFSGLLNILIKFRFGDVC